MSKKDCTKLLSKLYVSDLKAFLKRFGRSTSGRKQELLTRATEVVNARNSDVKTMAAFLRSIRPRTPRYTNFPHHVASLDPLTGLPSIPGFGSYPDLPLPPLEVNVPRMKANVAFCTSVYNQLDQHVLAPELLLGVSTGNIHSKYASYQITLNEEQRKKVGDGQHKVLLRQASFHRRVTSWSLNEGDNIADSSAQDCCVLPVTVLGVESVLGSCILTITTIRTSDPTHFSVYRLGRNEPKPHTPCSDHYPYELRVMMNTIRVSIPGYNPDLCRYPEYVYHCEPIDITAELKLEDTNRLEIRWKKAMSSSYSHVVCVELTQTKSVEELMFTLQKNVSSIAKTEMMITEKLDQSRDDGVAVTTDTLQVSLLCPLTMSRLAVPCRGFKCAHIQCFDAESYLTMNSKRESWKCPVCDQSTPYSSLVVDQLFKDILESPNSNNCTTISFSKDAKWKPITAQESIPTTNLSTPQKNLTSCDDVIDLTSSPQSTTSSSSTVTLASPPSLSTPSPSPTSPSHQSHYSGNSIDDDIILIS